MGTYTKNLYRRRKLKAEVQKLNLSAEHLMCCAIIQRGCDEPITGGHSHAELRRAHGYERPYESRLDDREGYWTSEQRFVGRAEAALIGTLAGQCKASPGEDLLSCDVTWWGDSR